MASFRMKYCIPTPNFDTFSEVFSLILIIRLFQFFVIAMSITHWICGRYDRAQGWHYFRISKWVFRLCALVCFGLSFGIIAIVEERDVAKYAIGSLFALACIYSAAMMALQSIWRIKYNDSQLIFRNSFGISSVFDLKELHIEEDGRMTHLKHRDKTITKWDSTIMDIQQEIALHHALREK